MASVVGTLSENAILSRIYEMYFLGYCYKSYREHACKNENRFQFGLDLSSQREGPDNTYKRIVDITAPLGLLKLLCSRTINKDKYNLIRILLTN